MGKNIIGKQSILREIPSTEEMLQFQPEADLPLAQGRPEGLSSD